MTRNGLYNKDMPKFLDLTGCVFGSLTAIKRSTEKTKYVYWVCKCTCGNKIDVLSNSLVRKKTISCGCSKVKRIIKYSTTHNMSRSPENICWINIKGRCSNKKRSDYKYYGGRGITVCDEWYNSFETFYKDMGPRPSKNHSIDRIDSEKGYSKENCRWATKSEQVINTKKRKIGSSKFKGVVFNKSKNKWETNIQFNYKRHYIGNYENEIEAAKAYDKKALELFGENANLNFKKD